MKTFFTLFLCLIASEICTAQVEQCVHCKMDIENDSFKAQAKSKAGKILNFDAIECLVNYLKTKKEINFLELLVTDYRSGNYIKARDAFYLKSEAIQSPMGAYLSAFLTETMAINMQKENGGKLFRWEVLKERFVSSNFGAIDHSHHDHNRPEAYAPSSIMGDHLHPKGGFMISFQYMNMVMGGNLEGNDNISDEDIYQRFMVAPQDMIMQMSMIGIMYAPSDKITLMLMQNFAKKTMDLTARMTMPGGMPMLRDFTTSSDGLGDLKLGLLYGLLNGEKMAIHINTLVNVPVGDIKNRGATPMMADVKLPYTMQLGTGTIDFTFGGTIKGSGNKFSWGLQQLNTIRTGTNDASYRFGNIHQLHSWLGYGISSKISTSIRLSGSSEGQIKEEDPELNPMMVTTANTANYGGELVRGAIGFNFLLAKDKLVLGAEVGMPLFQNYNGIFMDEDLAVNTCIKYTVF